MSDMIRKELFPGVWLRSIHTDKFKSAYLSVTLMTALDAEKAGANALIPYVLRRGTAVHPDMESLSAALDAGRKLRLGRSDPELTSCPSCAPCASLLRAHIAPCAPFPSALPVAVLTRDEGWNQDVSLGLVSCSGAQTPSPAVLPSNCLE